MIYECVGSEKEKIKQEFADIIDGLNFCGKIDYLTYSSLFDSSMELFDEMYDEGCKYSDETLKEENDRIRRTMLIYSECIAEHQNTIKELNEKITQMSCCWNCEHKEDCVIEDYNNVCDKWRFRKHDLTIKEFKEKIKR